MRSKDDYRSGKRNRGVKSDVTVKRVNAQAGEPRGKSFYPHPATKNFFFPDNKKQPKKVLDEPAEKLTKKE